MKLKLAIVAIIPMALFLSFPTFACGCGHDSGSPFDLSLKIALFLAATSYLIGSIPFGLLIGKLIGVKDIRETGSGNIGATNVLRTGNKFAAAATLILDALKGVVALQLAHWVLNTIGEGYEIAFGITMCFVILGHCFPVWLKFKGGKGVATYIGTAFGTIWIAGVIACIIWILTALISKRSSLAGIVMVCFGILGFLFIMLQVPQFKIALALFILGSLIVLYRHKDNIKRLINGTEPKIGQK